MLISDSKSRDGPNAPSPVRARRRQSCQHCIEASVADSTLDLNGIVTIKGKSKPVTLAGRYRGVVKGADGRERIGFEATGMVDRRDFDISWNERFGGTELIGNTVEIVIGLEAVRVD